MSRDTRSHTHVFQQTSQTRAVVNGGEHGRCVWEDITGHYPSFVCRWFCGWMAGKQNAKKILGLAEEAFTG